ncbi:MAG: hypothetical protein LBH24_02645 [Clostridiales bacterium]|jgi:hypothetical protein|nr:hypothetical protein [Clostridiales bacterium]
MGNKLKATAAGFGASLGGVAVWIIMSAFVGVIAGWAGALMGILFLLVYRKLAPADKSVYPYLAAIVLVVIEIVISELISIAIIAGMEGVSFSQVMEYGEVRSAVMSDLLIGFILTALVFGLYIFNMHRRDKMASRAANRPAGQYAPYVQTGNNAAPADPQGVDPFAQPAAPQSGGFDPHTGEPIQGQSETDRK